MAPLLCGLTGGLVAAYLAFKHEWPAVSVLAFAAVGFVAMYGLGAFVIARTTPAAPFSEASARMIEKADQGR